MGLCFALSLATLACFLLPAGCCVICDQSVLAALKSLKENYLPGHLDTKLHKKVMETTERILVEFKDQPLKDGSFLGALGEGRRDLESLVLGKDGRHSAPPSFLPGEKFVKQLYQMLDKEKAKFAQHAAQFQKEASLDCLEKPVSLEEASHSHALSSDRKMKVREKRNLTLNCLLKWHRFSVGLTDYQFFRDWEDGGETLLYKGKNPILIIPSVTSDDTGLYRCELGTVSSGPATIIRYHVTVQGEMTPTQGETAPVQGETAPPGQVETASPQDETAPGQGETALLVGETAPLLGDMAPLEEASVRPNSADVETSSATLQPSQAESMLHGPLIGLLVCSSVALIAALGVR
uniref:Ig-like domain-containing protein n=1 Tax=Sciurus vulgaris TaxID=55149 RepID=A0A8D2DI50_SCIVU